MSWFTKKGRENSRFSPSMTVRVRCTFREWSCDGFEEDGVEEGWYVEETGGGGEERISSV